MKKLTLRVVTLLLAASFVLPAVSSAQTIDASSLAAQIQSLMAQLQALQAQVAALSQHGQTSGSGSASGSCVFSTDLVLGASDSNVSNLQQALINLGYLSIEHPSGYFGPLTKGALTSFQREVGIAQSGNLDAPTRQALGTACANFSHAQSQSATNGQTSQQSNQNQAASGANPVILNIYSPASAMAGVPVSVSVSAIDPAGYPLLYAFAWGDGSNSSAASALMGSHTYTAAGTYSVGITVTDMHGGTTSQTITITVAAGQTTQNQSQNSNANTNGSTGNNSYNTNANTSGTGNNANTNNTQSGTQGAGTQTANGTSIVASTSTVSTSTNASGVQHDAQRLVDMQTIMNALEQYRVRFGMYPNNTSNNDSGESGATPGCGGWDISADNGNNFIAELVTTGFLSRVPVDPLNTKPADGSGCGRYSYRYYRYPAGQYGSDLNKGGYYVLGVTGFETVSGRHPSSPGWSEPGVAGTSNVFLSARDWQGEFSWVTGKYENPGGGTGPGTPAYRDAQRLNDMQTIMNALEQYKSRFGDYPDDVTNQDPGESDAGGCGGWDVSADNPNNFLTELVSKGFLASVPVDPLNTKQANGGGCGGYSYRYFRYIAGTAGADTSQGDFYVLGVNNFETLMTPPHPASPGWRTSGSDWQPWFPWVTGKYQGTAAMQLSDTLKKAALAKLQTALNAFGLRNGSYNVLGGGYQGGGAGWAVLENAAVGYPKSVAHVLRDGGFLDASTASDPYLNSVNGRDLSGFMIYGCFGPSYSLSAKLNFPSSQDITNIQASCNGVGANGISTVYGRNYALVGSAECVSGLAGGTSCSPLQGTTASPTVSGVQCTTSSNGLSSCPPPGIVCVNAIGETVACPPDSSGLGGNIQAVPFK